MEKNKIKKQINVLEDFKRKGYTVVCLGCNTVYKEIPQQKSPDGHGGGLIDMCKHCPSDLFVSVEGLIYQYNKKLDL